MVTPRGSRLYGTSHADSDYDYFVVVDKVSNRRPKYAKQKIVSSVDYVVMDFGTFLNYSMAGVPENLEAMFSTQAEVDEIADFRSDFRVSTAAFERYLRTIRNFCYTPDNKRKRHGLRLALNMHDFSRYGRFDPTLTQSEADYLTLHAMKDCDSVYAMAMNMALDRLPPDMRR